MIESESNQTVDLHSRLSRTILYANRKGTKRVDIVPAGDPQRTWFPEMISYLRSHWNPQLKMPEIIALRGELEEMLQRIRSSRNIQTSVLICPNCGLRAHLAAPHVTVRAMILSLGRFGIMSYEETKTLEKRWKQYRAANQLNLIGDPIDTGLCQPDAQAPGPNQEIPVELKKDED